MGAGQQWATFMRPGSTLLSIGWSKWKNDYYAKYARVRMGWSEGVHFGAVLNISS